MTWTKSKTNRHSRLDLLKKIQCTCGRDGFYVAEKDIPGTKTQIGAYCMSCGKWLRWISPDALK